MSMYFTETHFKIPSNAYFLKYIPLKNKKGLWAPPSNCSCHAALILQFQLFPRLFAPQPIIHTASSLLPTSPKCHPLRIHQSILLKIHVWLDLLSGAEPQHSMQSAMRGKMLCLSSTQPFFSPARVCRQKSGKVIVADYHSLEEGSREMRQIHLPDEHRRTPHHLHHQLSRVIQGSLAATVSAWVEEIVLLTPVWPHTSNRRRINWAYLSALRFTM